MNEDQNMTVPAPPPLEPPAAPPRARPTLTAGWLLDLYARPGRALSGPALAMDGSAVFALVWVMGVAGAIDRLDQQLVMGRVLPQGNDWGAYWMAAGLGGLLTGAIRLGVLGSWFHLRVHLSGARSATWQQTRRLYVSASLVVALPVLLLAGIATLVHPTPAASAESPLLFLELSVILLPYWACWAAYRGARVGLQARRGRGIFWLLIVPGLGIVVAQGAVLAAAWFLSSAPDTRRPQTFTTAAMQFEAPGNWRLVTPDDGWPPSWSVEAHGATGESRFDVLMRYSDLELPDRLEEIVIDLENAGNRVRSRSPLRIWGPQFGAGAEMEIDYDGDAYVVRVLVMQVAPGVTGELTWVVLATQARQARAGADLILRTLRFTPPESQQADLARARIWRNRHFEAEVPGNWSIHSWSGEGQAGPGAIFSAPDGSFWRLFSYTTQITATEELWDSLRTVGADADRVEMLDRASEYRHLPCVGQMMRMSIGDDSVDFGAYIIPLETGTTIEIQEWRSAAHEERNSAGFDLIGRSLRVRSGEPDRAALEQAPPPSEEQRSPRF